MSDPERRAGRVKWFDDVRGFGFVTATDGTDHFVHHMDIDVEGYRTLQEGQAVTFAAESGPKGPRARAVAPAARSADH